MRSNSDTARSPKRLTAGGREWELAFADTTLGERERNIISVDLNLVFGHLGEVVIDRLPEPLRAECDGRQVNLTHRSRFEGGTRKWPKVFQHDQFACLIEGDADERLYVPKAITDAYRAAIARKDTHEEAYDRLDELISRLNSLKQQPIEDAKDLFVVAVDYQNAQLDISAIKDDQFAATWGRYTFRTPSILAVELTKGTLLDSYGGLMATVYLAEGDKFDETFPFVYNGSQWRMVVFRPRT